MTGKAEEHADLIADNRIAELAETDSKVLKDLLSEIDTGELDMDITGFSQDELESLMTQVPPLNLDSAGEDFTICPKCGHALALLTSS